MCRVAPPRARPIQSREQGGQLLGMHTVPARHGASLLRLAVDLAAGASEVGGQVRQDFNDLARPFGAVLA